MTKKLSKSPISLREYLERTGRIDEKCVECGSSLFYDIDGIQVCDSSDGQLHYKGPIPGHLKWLNGIMVGNHIYYRNVCWKCLFNDIRAACKEQLWRITHLKGWPKEIVDGKDILPPTKMPAIGQRLLPLIFKGVSKDDIEKNSSRYDSASLESFIKHHGEEAGRQKYEDYVAFQSAKNTFEYKRDHKGWTKEQFDEYNKSRAVTLENLQKRYGREDGRKRFNAYCKLQAYAGCALEYFQELYGEEEGKRKYLELNKQKGKTIENFINKYGETEGREKWKVWHEYVKKHLEFMRKRIVKLPYSNVSQKLFNEIMVRLDETKIQACHFATHNNETRIQLPNGQIVFSDFTLDKKIIEFNGDYWHRNPELYIDDLITEDAESIWERDKTRIRGLEELGYSVLVVWELDYRRNPEEVIQRCLGFLNG